MTELHHALTCPDCRNAPNVLVLVCPECGNPEALVVWVGSTPRYADHNHPDTGQRCEIVGGGVGSHNLATAHPRRTS